MVCEGTKRIVIIKDIPSNFIEEAIFILKSENGEKEAQGEKNSQQEKKSKDFLLKEAELIIENYIKDNKMQAEARRSRDMKRGFLKRLFSREILLNVALAAGIILMAVIVAKIF